MMMFLDYDVQGILVRWAKDHGIDDDHLAHVFQYPRGRGADALVRHYPGHANHFHVRFKCPADDQGCR
jgi:murein endopeptidase